MRKKIAAGNWKMNKTYNEAYALADTILNGDRPSNVEVILGVPYPYLLSLQELIHAGDHIDIAAQNCHQEPSGAFTGEVSVGMLKSVGIQNVIVGHSERREYFGETEYVIFKKLMLLHQNGMMPIYCCGEPLDIRKANHHKEYVLKQLGGSLLLLDEESLLNTVIAYEPIWAIGTGETASPEQAQEMHAIIRQAIAEKYGNDTANEISILYGGSVKANNAETLFSQPDVDGGLVGGASLNAEEFLQIINSF